MEENANWRLQEQEMVTALWRMQFAIECQMEETLTNSPRYAQLDAVLNLVFQAIKALDPNYSEEPPPIQIDVERW